jgi:hypothetical protein
MKLRHLWLPAIAWIAAIGIAPAAVAEDDEEARDRTGAYLQLGFSMGMEEFQPKAPAAALDFSTGLGLDVVLGVRVCDYIAAEAEFQYLDRFNADNGPNELAAIAFTTNFKAIYPSGERWGEPYLLIGLGALNRRTQVGPGASSATDFAARFGGGIDIPTGDHLMVGVRTTYLLTTFPVNRLDYVDFTFNIGYRF